MSRRTDIRDKFEDLINAISGIGTAPDTITGRKVLKHYNELGDDNFPAAFPIPGDAIPRDFDVDSLIVEMNMQVVCYVRNDTDQITALENFIQKVEKAICTAATRIIDGLWIEVKPIRIETDHGLAYPFGVAEITFLVQYQYTYGEP